MIDNTTQQEHSAAKESVIRGADIQKEVRNIVVEALSDGRMDTEQIKGVVRAVVEGALEGATAKDQQSTEAIKQTVNGIDDALTQVVQASKLAIEEAASNIEDYTDHDLKRALSDLKDLEGLFFEVLGDAAKAGKETSYSVLSDLIHHAQQSSTSVGRTISEVSNNLYNFIANNRKNIHTADAARATGASIARIAGGFLAGIADTLAPDDKS